jgi:hypothetical protein
MSPPFSGLKVSHARDQREAGGKQNFQLTALHYIPEDRTALN